jgi:ABC-type glycerol-3-phosphate transport system substrate-binding protein
MRLSRFAVLLAATLTLGVGAARAQTEIVFYHYQAGDSAKSLRTIIDEFQRDNPGIVVKDIFKQSEQITAEVQAALAARRPVDVATVIGKNVVFFAKNTPAVPLNVAAGSDRAWLDGYLPNFLDAGRIGDRVFAIPHAYGTPQIYINRDIFRKAGLDPDRAPRTWDDVIAAAKQIKDRTGMAGVAHLHAAMGDYGTMVMVTNAGATYLTSDGSEAKFDSPQGIAVLQMWQDMAKSGIMPVANDQQWTAAFQAGQMGMYITSSAALQGMVKASSGKFELGVAQYPLWKDQPRRVNNSGAALMLYSPEGPRREASVKLLRYLSRQDVSNRWSRETGYMPLIRDPEKDPAMAAYIQSFPLVRPSIQQMSETVPTATWPAEGSLEAQTHIKNMLDELWAGRRPAREIVPEAVRKVNTALAPNRKS